MSFTLPVEPLSARSVHRNALRLAYLCCRAMVDGDPASQPAAAHIPALLARDGIASLQPSDRQLLDAPFGALPQDQRIAASWLAEQVVVLAWAIQRSDLPPLDTPCAGAPAALALGLFHLHQPQWCDESDLRARSEIERTAVLYAGLYWRLLQLLRSGQPQSKDASPASVVPPPASDSLDDSDGARLLHQLSAARLREVLPIVRERHRALRWLLGLSPTVDPSPDA